MNGIMQHASHYIHHLYFYPFYFFYMHLYNEHHKALILLLWDYKYRFALAHGVKVHLCVNDAHLTPPPPLAAFGCAPGMRQGHI